MVTSDLLGVTEGWVIDFPSSAGHHAGWVGEAGLVLVVVTSVLAPLLSIYSVNLCSFPSTHTHVHTHSGVFQVSVRAVNLRGMTPELPEIGVKAAHFPL